MSSQRLGMVLGSQLRSRTISRLQPFSSTPSLRAETEHPGSDTQEDSSANAAALKESLKKAQEFEDIAGNFDHEKDGQPQRNPEVKDKTGKSFPHQTDEDRQAFKATTTEGEAKVKTREYTPKEGTDLYDDEAKK